MNPKEIISIALVTNKELLKEEELLDFLVGIQLTNATRKRTHVNLSSSQLYVNGNPSIAWSLAVQNGTLINLSLAPGEAKTIQWPLGKALFPVKGNYLLELKWKGMGEERSITIN